MTIRLALDWTPNTNHTGFYVALAQGLYENAQVSVVISTPDQDDYQTTPARQLAQGQVDLAVAPSESVISYQTNGVPLVAIAALLARDASAIVTLERSGIERPQQLDNRVYGSYSARYEDEIVRQLIRNDGGQGAFETNKPARLNLWQALLDQQVDATWIFLPWEGVEAAVKNVGLNVFKLGDYGIPYGYSPILMANRDWATQHADGLRKFMQATSAGFRWAAEHPAEAAQLLMDTAKHPTLNDPNFLQQSQRTVAGYYLDAEGQWGLMEPTVWEQFIQWLTERQLLTVDTGSDNPLDVKQLYTNEFLVG